MKNTLKISLLLIGLVLLVFAAYGFFRLKEINGEDLNQLLGMTGVALLFLLAGFSMGKR